MATSEKIVYNSAYAARVKVVIGELEERACDLRLFDGADVVSVHCNDLICDVELTLESTIKDLNRNHEEQIKELSKNSNQDESESHVSSHDFEHLIEKLNSCIDQLTREKEDLVIQINSYLDELIKKYRSSINDQTGLTLKQDLAHLIQGIHDLSARHQDQSEDQVIRLASHLMEETKELRRRMRNHAFHGSFMQFQESDILRKNYSIGKLVLSHKDPVETIIKHVVLDELTSDVIAHHFIPPRSYIGRIGDSVQRVLFLSDGNLAVKIDRSLPFIWSPVTREKVFVLEHDVKAYAYDLVRCLAQLPNGLLVTGDNHGQINIWDLEAQKFVRTLVKIPRYVYILRVLPNGNLISSNSKVIQIWDPNGKAPECLVATIALTRRVDLDEHMQVLSNGCIAFVSSSYNIRNLLVRTWDPENGGRVIKDTKLPRLASFWNMLASGDLVVGRADGTIEIHSLLEEKMYRTVQKPGSEIFLTTELSAHSIMFVYLNNRLLPFFSPPRYPGSFNPNYDFEYCCTSKDRKHLLIGTGKGVLAIWSLASQH